MVGEVEACFQFWGRVTSPTAGDMAQKTRLFPSREAGAALSWGGSSQWRQGRIGCRELVLCGVMGVEVRVFIDTGTVRVAYKCLLDIETALQIRRDALASTI